MVPPRLAPSEWDFADELRMLAFVDGARTWVIQPLNELPGRFDIASSGIGITNHLVMSMFLAASGVVAAHSS